MALKDAPTSELGAPGVTAQGGWLQTWETTPEVAWPRSTAAYDLMRRDGHLASTLKAVTLPIRRTRWHFDDSDNSDVRPEVIDLCRADLGIDQHGEGRQRRRRQGISFDEALQHSLLMLPFGHMPLEQVYEIGPADATGLGQVAHLRKLAPRMPQTISQFHIASDGGLDGISQWVSDDKGIWRQQLIPMDRMVFFCNEREGSDWAGQSVLRPAYGHWLFKQQLMRIDAMACERNGMGVPIVKYGQNGSKREALDLARNVRSGEDAGAALSEGDYDLELLGVTGSVRDILPSIQYHDQEMSRSVLAMFLDLGHDNGARSLGDTFVEFFVLAQQAVADYIAETFTEHVVRDLVEINFGPDEPYPVLCADEISSASEAMALALAALTDKGLITPDGQLEDSLRDRWGLPAAAVDERPPPPVPPAVPGVAPLAPVAPVVPLPVAASAAPTLEELEARLAVLKANQGRPVR